MIKKLATVLLFAAASPVLSQTAPSSSFGSVSTTSTSGGFSGPCQFASEPDVCVPFPAGSGNSSQVPEPEAFGLFALGAFGIFTARKLRRR
jgi:PEP-CTERM motif